MEMDEIKQKVLEDVDPPTKKAKRHRRIKGAVKTVLEFALIVIVVGILFQIAFGLSKVEGTSMYPTLHDRDVIIYNRLDKNYNRGDIVAITMPDGERYVKRVAAVAGDTVNVEGGSFYINGKEWATEQSLGETKATGDEVEYPVKVKDGEVFVLGDNRENSEDSRMFGAIETDCIKGRLCWYIGKAR